MIGEMELGLSPGQLYITGVCCVWRPSNVSNLICTQQAHVERFFHRDNIFRINSSCTGNVKVMCFGIAIQQITRITLSVNLYAGVNCTVYGNRFFILMIGAFFSFCFYQIHDFDIMRSLYNHVTINFVIYSG